MLEHVIFICEHEMGDATETGTCILGKYPGIKFKESDKSKSVKEVARDYLDQSIIETVGGPPDFSPK